MRLHRDIWKYAAAVVAAVCLTNVAAAQVVYFEDFADEELPTGTYIGEATIANGIITFLDDSASARGAMTVDFVETLGGPLTATTATFSFDIVQPVFETPPAQFEMLIRAGTGSGGTSLQSGQQIAEGIAYRTDTTEPIDSTRGDYENNGQETLFMVVNNQNAPITFPHPGDGTEVSMAAWQTATYVHNTATDTWGVVRGVSGFQAALSADFGDFERFSIGTSSSGHQGGFAMDNVLVMEGITFERPTIDTGTPGDVDGDDDVDMIDFGIIQSHFQQAVAGRSEGDIAGFDNFVDFRDFRQWKSNFPTPGPGPAGAVPEPATALLAGLAVAGLARLRRRR